MAGYSIKEEYKAAHPLNADEKREVMRRTERSKHKKKRGGMKGFMLRHSIKTMPLKGKALNKYQEALSNGGN